MLKILLLELALPSLTFSKSLEMRHSDCRRDSCCLTLLTKFCTLTSSMTKIFPEVKSATEVNFLLGFAFVKNICITINNSIFLPLKANDL